MLHFLSTFYVNASCLQQQWSNQEASLETFILDLKSSRASPNPLLEVWDSKWGQQLSEYALWPRALFPLDTEVQ